MGLREWLIERQRLLGENDSQFGRRLSLPRSWWRMVRLGERGISMRVARGAYAAFPDERELICSLALGESESANSADAA